MAERRTRLDTPAEVRRGPSVRYDPEAFGRTTERIARFLGTGRYLVVQSIIIALWIIWNAVVPKHLKFDPYAFPFLTLVLSLQAAYAAPLILLAQNRQDDRDRINLDQDRDQSRQAQAEVEYLARELAAVRIALGDVVTRDFLRAELARASNPEPRKGERKSDRKAERFQREESGQP